MMKKQLITGLFISSLITFSNSLSTKMLEEVAGAKFDLEDLSSASYVSQHQQPTRDTLQSNKPEVEQSPFVKHVGLFYTMMFGSTGIGFDFGHSFDLGMNFKFPYYSDREYLVLGADTSAHVAGFSWLQLITPYLRGSINLEINGVKFQPRLRGLFDTSNYSDLCMSLDTLTSGLEMVMTTNVDIKDCNVGLIGTIYQLGWVIQQGYSSNYGQSSDCDFRSYWFEKRPLVKIHAGSLL